MGNSTTRERKGGLYREVTQRVNDREIIDGGFIRRRVKGMGVRCEVRRGAKEEWGASGVIIGGCRHFSPLVAEWRICGRGGDGRCHSSGNGLDGLFGVENQGIALKVCLCVDAWRRLCVGCVCVYYALLVCSSINTPQHRRSSTGLLWKPQMMSSDWSHLRFSLYCSCEITSCCWQLRLGSGSPPFILLFQCFVYTSVSNNSVFSWFHRYDYLEHLMVLNNVRSSCQNPAMVHCAAFCP